MKDLRKAAADTRDAAAERGTELVNELIARLQPLVEQAGDKVGPIAHGAKVRTADFASRTLDSWEPAISDALDKVTPAVEAARTKVQKDLLPKLQHSLRKAAELPVAETVQPKKSKFKGFLKVVAIGTVVAGAIAAVRQFLVSKDDGWTAHEPSRAYVNTTNNFAEAQAEASAEAEAVDDMIDEGSPLPVEEDLIAETSPEYGEGSYVGEEPPAGYTIKGNERSMKYHLPGTGGFERTIPDVWFNSEEAAKAAGFTRAQR